MSANDPATAAGANRREAVVHGRSDSFVQSIRVAGHALTADEPVAAGGGETGPNPYDLLIAALGACTSMTISLYARRKNWPLEAVTVKLRHTKVHASDCAECETKDGMIDRIHREIDLHGHLDHEQRTRLLEIANKCPVHRTLVSEIDIRTNLA